ncbi:MAG: GNAT family N-acetyltransferase [bacterium]
MLQKGIKQWLKPIAFSKLEDRQSKGENYGLFDASGKLKVFLSLTSRTDYHEWADWFDDKTTIWLNTVSVNVTNTKKGLGRIAINQAIDYLKHNSVKELYLDCVINDGFLVEYYRKMGFQKIGETDATYQTGKFKVALMKKNIS